jgi:hypothetical protein
MGYLALDRYRSIEAELSAFCDRWNVAELALLDLPEGKEPIQARNWKYWLP